MIEPLMPPTLLNLFLCFCCLNCMKPPRPQGAVDYADITDENSDEAQDEEDDEFIEEISSGGVGRLNLSAKTQQSSGTATATGSGGGSGAGTSGRPKSSGMRRAGAGPPIGYAARRKRLSLPSIRLYSSLDSPGSYHVENARNAVDTKTSASAEHAPTVTAVGVDKDDCKATNVLNSMSAVAQPEVSISGVASASTRAMVLHHPSLAARRSREFMRAETEIIPPPSLADDYDDDDGDVPINK